MGISATAYPTLIYTQTTEPSDKSEGKLWFNTSSNKLYTSDGSNYVLVAKDISKTYSLSDNTLHENASAQTTANTTYTLLKTITLNTAIPAQIIRIKFALLDSGGSTAYGKIYLNGVAKNPEQSQGGSWATKSVDIDFGANLVEGDVIQLYAKSVAGQANVKEFKLSGTLSLGVSATDGNP